MSKTGVRSFSKDGGAHDSTHENKNIVINLDSFRNNASTPIASKESMLFNSEVSTASPLSSETDNYVLRTPPKSVVNDAELGVGVIKTICNSGKRAITVGSNIACSNTKTNDILSNQSAPLADLDGDGFVGVGEDIFEMGPGTVGGVSAESISLPLPIALDSNYLGPDFSDNLKDFVFSVSDSDNLSKVDQNTSFDSVTADGSSFSNLLGNECEDSISDTLQVSFYDDLVGRVKSISSHVKEDPTMTSVVSKRTDGSVFHENELLAFASLPKLSSSNEKHLIGKSGSTTKSEPTQNVFHPPILKSEPSQDIFSPYQNTSDDLFMTLRADDKLNSSPCKLSTSLFPSSSIMTSLSNISDLRSALNVQNFVTAADATGTNASRDMVQELSLPSMQMHNAQNEELNSTAGIPSSSNQNVNITTISISNKENNSIKILVHSDEGQNVYVINSSDLKDGRSGNKLLNENQSFFASATDLNLNQTSTSSSHQSSSLDSPYVQSNPSSAVSGIFLFPIQPKAESDGEKPLRGKKVVMCNEPGCNKTFRKSSKLKVHKMLHTGERPFKCTFPGCLWAFTTPHKLKRHMESHEGRKDFACDYPGCGHKFTTVYNLNTHRKIHDRPYSEMCPEEGCGQAFHTKRQLEFHLRTVHGVEDRTYKCPKPGCDKVFYSSACMGSHMRVHAQNASYKCKFPDCDKEFNKLCRLRQHEIFHTGEKPFICKYEGCTWAFATASKLKRHQTKHTGVRKWQCHICRKFFMRSEHLKGHLITHSGDRPFVCPVEGCGNAFTAKSSLYVHLRKHDESGKTIIYHCPMDKCDRHYACKASLRQHIMVKHCVSPKDTPDSQQLPQAEGEGVINWLNLLDSSDAAHAANVVGTDPNLGQEQLADAEGLVQTTLTPTQDTAVDFLTEDVSNQTILHPVASAGMAIPDPQTCGSLIHHPQKMVVISSQAVSNFVMTTPTTGSLLPTSSITLSPTSLLSSSSLSSTLRSSSLSSSLSSSSPSSLLSVASPAMALPAPSTLTSGLDPNNHPHQIHQSLIQAGVILQQETASKEALERSKKCQFMFDNMQGCARTDEYSNKIISERAFKRWQKQKEIEAAKLRAHLESQTTSSSSLSSSSTLSTNAVAMIPPSSHISVAASGLTSLSCPNVSLAGQHNSGIGRDGCDSNASAMIFQKEIPDLELQAEGIQGSVVLDRRPTTSHGDSFMTELFIKDPETGMTYRQTQLLQDDPPTLCLLEDMAEVEPSHNVVLDASLEGNLMEESGLPFDDL